MHETNPPLHPGALRLIGLAPLLALLLLPEAGAQSQPFWPQFRGPNGQGTSPAARPPVSLAKSNALWTAEVPPGHSSPAVWGNRIFLTAAGTGNGCQLEAEARGGGGNCQR